MSRRTSSRWLALALFGLAGAPGLAACADEPEPVVREAAPVKVHAHRVQTSTARHFIYGQGTAKAVRRELLSFEVDGRVAYIKESAEGRTLQVGDHVRGPSIDDGETYGELLASLDDRELAASLSAREAQLRQTRDDQAGSSADLDSAKAEYDNAKTELERMQALVSAKAAPQSELDGAKSRHDKAKAALDAAKARRRSSQSGTTVQEAELERAQLTLDKASIFAPFDGVVAYMNIREGDYFYASTLAGKSETDLLGIAPIVVIDPSQFEITLDIPAHEAREIERGQTVIVVTGDQIAEVASGRTLFDEALKPTFAEVWAVSPSIDPGSRTVEVKVRTTAESEQIRDGEFVSAWIVTAVSEDTTLVPFDAIVRREQGPIAYVVDESTGLVEARPLDFGIRDMIGMEVRGGLAAGERVVTEGRHALAEGSAVEVVGETALASPSARRDEVRP